MDAKKFEQLFTGIERNIITSSKSGGYFYLNQDTVRLLSLLNENQGVTLIPNLSMGELTLCAEKSVGYSADAEVYRNISAYQVGVDADVINEDFLCTTIKDKYFSIVLFPPFGVRTEYGRSEIAYINKALDLLQRGGRLIAIVTQNVTTAPAFRNLRERILSEFSLTAVLTTKHISIASAIECSILVIENKPQAEHIYMLVKGENADQIFEGFKLGNVGFYTESSEVYDRIDANYFDPQYKEVRNLVQNRDTVKLGDIADIFSGMMINSRERRDEGIILSLNHSI